ncbi:MAG: anhydro-N-acetylmuramic acid kinase [Alphaproteobacteria bacterium]|nr:anhydro-N-acetylmuramic acid kinase [Alphaproteobacteria bacterium]
MIERKIVLGVYSDSSLNNVELGLIETDGIDIFEKPVSLLRPYSNELKDEIYKFMLKGDFSDTLKMSNLSKKITAFHKEAIDEFICLHKRNYPKIHLIGYSGHTVYQNPDEKVNITLGNFEEIANHFKIPVIGKFLNSDLTAGGRGGPIFTTFYDALTRNEKKPLCIVSLGGIITMTSINPFGQLQAFDSSIGLVLLDHWIYTKTGSEMDFNGKYAKLGQVDTSLVNHLLKDKYILKTPPKTVRRESFMDLYKHIEGCSVETGAASLTNFIAKSIHLSSSYFNESPIQFILTGGGIYNPTLIQMIKQEIKQPVKTALDCGWDNDTLNAQAYAFLAVRSQAGLPISFPQTTGAYEAVTGGKTFYPTDSRFA